MGLRTFAIFGLVLIATLCNTLSAEFTVSNRQKYLEELYLKSLHLLNNDRPREALPLIQEYLRTNPHDAMAVNNLGVCYQRMDMERSAIKVYHGAIELTPNNPSYRANLALAYNDVNDFDRAIEYAEAALAIDDEHAHAQFAMGYILKSRGRSAEALPYLTRAIELAPRNRKYRLARADAYERLDEIKLSVSDHQVVIDYEPENTDLHHEIAMLYFEWRDSYDHRHAMRRALYHLEATIYHGNRSCRAYANRATAFKSLGEYEEALRDIETALLLVESRNDRWFVRRRQALIYLDMQRNEEALEAYAEVLRLHPRDSWSFCNRALIYNRMDRHEAAIADMEKAIALNAREPKLRDLYGAVLSDAGRYEDAAAAMERAFQLRPDCGAYLAEKGQYLAMAGLYEKGLEEANRGIAVSPDHPDAYHLRANYYVYAGQYELAYKDAMTALRINDTVSSYHSLGAAYIAIGLSRYAEGAEHMQRYADLYRYDTNKRLNQWTWCHTICAHTLAGNDDRVEQMLADYTAKGRDEDFVAFYRGEIDVDEYLDRSEDIKYLTDCYHFVAMLYDAKGQTDEAMAYYKQVYDYAPMVLGTQATARIKLVRAGLLDPHAREARFSEPQP